MAIAPTVVFFDVGNTLLFPNWQRILTPLTKREVDPSSEQLRAIERQTKTEFDQMVAGGGGIDHSFWRIFYSHLLESFAIRDQDLAGMLTAATRVSANWDRMQPGTREALERIGKRYRIGVISNADGKITHVLTTCSIHDCFLNITDSGVVGQEKPHPAIFESALRELGAQPEQCLYVGDVYCVDYVGATRVGMQAMLFDVCGAYREKELPRVESLEELEAVLTAQFMSL